MKKYMAPEAELLDLELTALIMASVTPVEEEECGDDDPFAGCEYMI